MSEIAELIAKWRDIGPVAWSEGSYGWLNQAGVPINPRALAKGYS